MSRVQYIVDRLRELAQKSLADRPGQFDDFASYLVTSQGRTDLDIEMTDWELYLKVQQSTTIVRAQHFASFDQKLLEFIRNWSAQNGRRAHLKPAGETKRQRRERVVLEAIKKCGYDPRAIPVHPAEAEGKGGVRVEVMKAAFLIDQEAFGPDHKSAVSAFRKTWYAFP